MQFFVDIADIDDVKKVNEYFTIDGFTTNPNILTKSEKSLSENFALYREYLKTVPEQKIFVQVTAKTAEEMLSQAEKLSDFFGKALVVKLPAVKEGYKALKLCKAKKMTVCMTVIHSLNQALLSAKSGADYVAPYVTHIDNIGADGTLTVKKMADAFRYYGYPTKVLGASFRTAEQIERLAGAGCHAVTVTPQFFDLLIAHASTNESMAMFEKAWHDRFGDQEVTDGLK